jgi:hypothetical protein
MRHFRPVDLLCLRTHLANRFLQPRFYRWMPPTVRLSFYKQMIQEAQLAFPLGLGKLWAPLTFSTTVHVLNSICHPPTL